MKWPNYPKYKDSGVDWVGEVPEGWAINRLKFLCTIQTGNKDTVDALDEGQYPFFVRSPQIEKINSFSYDGEAVLTAGDGVGVGKVYHYFIGKFDFHQRVYMMCDFQNISGRFFYFYLVSMFHKVALEGGAKSTVDSLRMPLFLNFQLTIPSESEQRIIVEFCDRQTERIDSLIAEQEKLVSLLQEKRQAVISHAVTKGLNPDAPMKDPGMEWLGMIPKKWDVFDFRKIIDRVEQGWSPNTSSESCQNDDDWGVLKISAVKFGRFIQNENKALLEDVLPIVAYRVFPGDLLLTRANTPSLVGDCCVVSDDLQYRLMMSDLIYRIRVIPEANTYFLSYLLRSNFARAQIKADARGSSMTMSKISQGHIKKWIIVMPPQDEQQAIVEYLDAETTKIDVLITEVQQSIELLRERRTALISAAVTGKIDVRGLTASEPA